MRKNIFGLLIALMVILVEADIDGLFVALKQIVLVLFSLEKAS